MPTAPVVATKLLIDANDRLLFAGNTAMPFINAGIYTRRDNGGMVARFSEQAAIDRTFGTSADYS